MHVQEVKHNRNASLLSCISKTLLLKWQSLKPNFDILKMRLHRIPDFVDFVYPKRLWRVPDQTKNLYITFDDGPTEKVTPWILDLLDQYNAKATFFCVGKNIEKHNQLLEKISDAGHKLGNHTHDHLNGWKSADDRYLDNIARCANLLQTKLFRPPYGKLTSSQAEALMLQGFRIVMWSMLTYDYDPNLNKEKTWQYIKNNIFAGDIIVFHDSMKAKENLEYLLPLFLDHFSKEGYHFSAL